jgi:hypothetical protein
VSGVRRLVRSKAESKKRLVIEKQRKRCKNSGRYTLNNTVESSSDLKNSPDSLLSSHTLRQLLMTNLSKLQSPCSQCRSHRPHNDRRRGCLPVNLQAKGDQDADSSPGPIIRWVENWLIDRSIETWIDGKPAGRTRVNCGVPQGSPCSPTLFALTVSETGFTSLLTSHLLRFRDSTNFIWRISLTSLVLTLPKKQSSINRWKSWSNKFIPVYSWRTPLVVQQIGMLVSEYLEPFQQLGIILEFHHLA